LNLPFSPAILLRNLNALHNQESGTRNARFDNNVHWFENPEGQNYVRYGTQAVLYPGRINTHSHNMSQHQNPHGIVFDQLLHNHHYHHPVVDEHSRNMQFGGTTNTYQIVNGANITFNVSSSRPCHLNPEHMESDHHRVDEPANTGNSESDHHHVDEPVNTGNLVSDHRVDEPANTGNLESVHHGVDEPANTGNMESVLHGVDEPANTGNVESVHHGVDEPANSRATDIDHRRVDGHDDSHEMDIDPVHELVEDKKI